MDRHLNWLQALLGAIGVGEKSATVIGATFQVDCPHQSLFIQYTYVPELVLVPRS
jgi:hypothetical protein